MKKLSQTAGTVNLTVPWAVDNACRDFFLVPLYTCAKLAPGPRVASAFGQGEGEERGGDWCTCKKSSKYRYGKAQGRGWGSLHREHLF